MGDRDRTRHPSGRPLRQVVRRSLPIMRITPTEPATPRLRRAELPSAIGFHVRQREAHED